MEKISIVSRRRRDKRFPDTEAQQRARVRELHVAGDQQTLSTDGLDRLLGALSSELPEIALDDLAGMAVLEQPCGIDASTDNASEVSQVNPDTAVCLQLSPEQSRLLRTIPFLGEPQEQETRPLTLDLIESRDPGGIVLQFSPHTPTIPEMMSLKELCRQLKVGRRAVTRLIREGKLRCYRIGRHYRFTTADVNQYLEQTLAQ